MSRSRRRREQDRRGEHKRWNSPETKTWAEIVEAHAWLRPEPAVAAHAAPPKPVRRSRGRWRPPPHRPSWMEPEEYEGLLRLKRRLL